MVKFLGATVLIGVLVSGVFWWSSSDASDEHDLKKEDYYSEQKEQERINKFFSELNRVYGYHYSEEGEAYQLFIKIDEAFREGELIGSLLMVARTEDEANPYEETIFEINGITDGKIVEFFTTVDGKATELKGSFREDATSFDMSFWLTKEKLLFQAITEKEFNQKYNEFKMQLQ